MHAKFTCKTFEFYYFNGIQCEIGIAIGWGCFLNANVGPCTVTAGSSSLKCSDLEGKKLI